MWQELDCDVTKATRQQSERMPGRPVPVGREDRLLRQQRQSDAEAAQGRRYRDGLLQRRQGRRALSDRSSPANTRSTTTTIRPVMGGTFANHMMFGYADALYYADANGDPATPNHVLVPARIRRLVDESRTPIRRPAPTIGTPMTAMAAAATPTAPTRPSRASPRSSAISNAMHVPPNCAPNALLSAQQLRARPSSAAAPPIRSTTARSRCRR